MKKVMLFAMAMMLVSFPAQANKTTDDACGRGHSVAKVECEGSECVYTCDNGEMFSLSAETLLEFQNR